MLADSLTDWTPYFALMGGAAATLLGLLFVAVSLRLNIFRSADVADVRLFAGFTLGTYLTGLAIAALALAPHVAAATLAAPLFLIGLLGIAVVAAIARVWMRLELARGGAHDGPAHSRMMWQALVQSIFMILPFGCLVVVAAMPVNEAPAALGVLAVAEAGLLGLGTFSSWLLLSHAGANPPGSEAES